MKQLQSLCDFLHLDDAEIYYEVTGNGPPLLFAHGLSGNHLSWWQQVPYFWQRYTCITFAHRGFAPSKCKSGSLRPVHFADDLTSLIDHLQLSDIFLVAQSMGGWACLEYAQRHPSRVRGLVLAATTGNVDLNSIRHVEMDRLNTWTKEVDKVRTSLRKEGIHMAAGRRMALEQPNLYFLYQKIEDLLLRVDKAALLRELYQMCILPADTLAQLHVPTIFIFGDEDVLGFPGTYSALASLIPNSRVECVPKCGHSVYFEQAQKFNHLVDSFLSSIID